MRRAAVLFEVLVSMALFVGAASFVLGALRDAQASLVRAERQSFAADLARTRMAEIELGLVSLADLRAEGAGPDLIGSLELERGELDGWSIAVETERTEYTGLSLVVLSVYPVDENGRVSDDASPLVELRQLMALGDEDVEEFEQDEMLRDLPEAARNESGVSPR